ncbi:XkdX family protein [Intestinibacillus massiliensis]|nr:XkdX family protein [Intestinibacillus massiliensis]
MYEFIRIQYQLGQLTAGQVKTYVPKWITEGEANTIINGQG